MKISSNYFAVAFMLVMLVVAVPYGLVQLDVIDADRLRIVPSLLTIILAVTLGAWIFHRVNGGGSK